MHKSTIPHVQAAIDGLQSDYPERDRLNIARTWLHVPSGDQGDPETWSKVVEVRHLVIARLGGAREPSCEALAAMLEVLVAPELP